MSATADDGDEHADREVAEGVHRFGTRRVNWYVVEGDDGVTVVDAGLPAHWQQLVDWLDRTGREVDDVVALVLTHADADHVGFAARLADRGVPVYCHPDDRPLLGSHPQSPPGWFYRNLWRPGFLRYAVELLRTGVTDVEALDDAEPLVDGETLPVPGEPRVIVAPGQTPGSCALLLEDRGVLLCGDVLATRDIYATGRGSPSCSARPTRTTTRPERRSLDSKEWGRRRSCPVTATRGAGTSSRPSRSHGDADPAPELPR
ncbi:MBL fold metallo-hydrolase [Halobaculum sp. EA56]|uniref:MBL fold metallo-hydrolase n=1 Tax=Halobaculum sp. EA56 TaxID=3421648 RepID=UPI003EBC4D50